MGFNVTKYEHFIDTISDSTLQLIFRKLLLVEFCGVSKRNNHNYLKRLLKYFSLSAVLSCER